MSIRSRGFTLIEFMISLSVGLCALTFLMHLYTRLYQNKLVMHNWHQKHYNLSTAFMYLTREIRMAGFIGCPNLQEVTIKGTHHFNTDQSIKGWHADSDIISNHEASLTAPVGEVLCIRYANPARVSVSSARKDSIHFEKQGNFKPHDVLLISDCTHAETLQLNRFQLHHTYRSDAKIGLLHHIVYYVGKTNRKNRWGYPVYALYRKDLNAPSHQPIELVEGIERLEILYGVLPSHQEGSLQYFKSEEITHWEQVRSVKIMLHPSKQNSAQHASQIAKRKYAQKNGLFQRPWDLTVAIRARL